MIPRLLLRSGWRHGRRHPWQVLLAVLGVALGVTVITAVDLTRSSATRSFVHATETVAGRTTHHIVGGPLGVDENIYSVLRRGEFSEKTGDSFTGFFPLTRLRMAPVIEANLVLVEHQDSAIQLLGVDPVVEGPVRGPLVTGVSTNGDQLTFLMTRAGTALISAGTANRLGLSVGETLNVAAGGLAGSLEIIGFIGGQQDTSALALTDLLVVDIATAQELLGMQGWLSRIDVVAGDDASIDTLKKLLPNGLELVEAESRKQSLVSMTAAFHTNLQALSLIALLVGIFLIYNSQTFMVVQRRATFGALRALGVTGSELMRLVLIEAAMIGFVGTVLGVFGGWLLAHELVGLATRTINDLYYSLAVGSVRLDALTLLKGVMLGLGGSLIAAVIPAREAGSVEPRIAMSVSSLESRSQRGARVALLLGLALVLSGLIVSLIPTRSVLAGFGVLFLVILGFTLTTPSLIRYIALALAAMPFVNKSLEAVLAFKGVAATLSRTGVAAAALMLAVATTLGIGIMIGSFRISVENWLGGFLQADYYVSLPASGSGPGASLMDKQLAKAIEAHPGIDHISHVRHLTLTTNQGLEPIAAFDLNPYARRGFQFIAKLDSEDFWSRFERDDVVLITESYAYHRQRVLGDQVRLRTPVGDRHFTVMGIYRDYGSDQGRISMSRALYDRHWPGDPGINGIGLYTEPEFNLEEFREALPAMAGEGRSFSLVANRAIREASLAVFDRTFTITEVLRLLAALIAFIGVFSALLAIQLERTRELGVLKAVGVSSGQLARIVMGETTLVGAVAGLYAIPVGTVLAVLLIQVINRRSFGWGMDFYLEPGQLVGGVLLALVAAILAAVYPAWRMSRLQPTEALRME